MQRIVTTQLLIGALCTAPFGLLRGQDVIKPGPTPSPRNPAPAKITASQQSDGRIRVIWSAVSDADKYALIRSVPNVGPARAVTLPDPKDTVYTDSDVQKGNTYYYQVHAINSAGLAGLNRGSTPVTATISAGEAPVPAGTLAAPAKITAAQEKDGLGISVVWSAVPGAAKYALTRSLNGYSDVPVNPPNPSDTSYTDHYTNIGVTYKYTVKAVTASGTAGLSISSPTVAVAEVASSAIIDPATNVILEAYPYNRATIRWTCSKTPGVAYLVEKATVSASGQSPWENLFTVPGNETCQTGWGPLDPPHPAGTRLITRVTATFQASPSNKSTPAVSNEITTYKIEVLSEIDAVKFKMGGTTYIMPPSYRLGQLTPMHWVSLNESVATVDTHGTVTARSTGSAFIVLVGVTPAGAVKSFVTRVDVVP
jgi:fibronectin type 3 domain-containing protein